MKSANKSANEKPAWSVRTDHAGFALLDSGATISGRASTGAW
ncbi:hypothetical protein [Caballeronia sp.]|nr:hypothetical protein [Caballeronia sp.]